MTILLAIVALIAMAYIASAVRCWSEVRRHRLPRRSSPFSR